MLRNPTFYWLPFASWMTLNWCLSILLMSRFTLTSLSQCSSGNCSTKTVFSSGSVQNYRMAHLRILWKNQDIHWSLYVFFKNGKYDIILFRRLCNLTKYFFTREPSVDLQLTVPLKADSSLDMLKTVWPMAFVMRIYSESEDKRLPFTNHCKFLCSLWQWKDSWSPS